MRLIVGQRGSIRCCGFAASRQAFPLNAVVWPLQYIVGPFSPSVIVHLLYSTADYVPHKPANNDSPVATLDGKSASPVPALRLLLMPPFTTAIAKEKYGLNLKEH